MFLWFAMNKFVFLLLLICISQCTDADYMLTAAECQGKQFKCKTTFKCVPEDYVCDGDDDCGDGSDEECSTCSPNFFDCGNDECIPEEKLCDGLNDCSNSNDESDCDYVQTEPECDVNFVKCKSSSQCISEKFMCDGDSDCEDKSDETECKDFQCQGNKFKCKTTFECVPEEFVCDGEDDCGDGSDEECRDLCENAACSQNCSSTPTGPRCYCSEGYVLDSKDNKTCNACDEFFCSATGQCLSWSKVCDGNEDCQNMTDEGGLCLTSCADEKGDCSHICQKTPQGSKCFCDKGYRLLPDNKTCEDINECREVGTCSHFCNNRKDSYVCSCHEGYTLKDKNSCVAEGETPMLIYLSGDFIRVLDLDSRSLKFHLIVKGANMRAIDYDVAEDVFYWTELNDGTINCYSSNYGYDIVYQSCSKPVAVRYDWLTRNLYFLDENSSIGVCRRNGKICRILVKSGAEVINSLAISPLHAYMFWTVWASSSFQNNRSGVIQRAEMDGSDIKKIVSSNLHSPTAITVDAVLQRIYWADIKLKRLESADFLGFNRRQIEQSDVYHPVASVVFEDYVYLVDWGTKSIKRCHKFIPGRCENVTEGDVIAHDLVIAHKVMQPKNYSMCLEENGGCSHLCLAAPKRRICACPSAMTLGADGRSCIATVEQTRCEGNEFRCDDGACIPDDFKCDGSKQCNDGSDEASCGSCEGLGMHRCYDGTCVPNYQICDGKKDCSNNEDELNCIREIRPNIE